MVELSFHSNLFYPLDQQQKIAEKMDYTYHISEVDYPREHLHQDYWEFSVFLEGEANHYINGQKEILQKGTLFYQTTNDFHCLRYKGKKNIRFLNIVAKEKPLLNLLNAISPTFSDVLLNNRRLFSIPDHIILNVEEILHKANMLSSQQYETHSQLILSALLLILQFLYAQQIEQPQIYDEWEKLLNDAMQTKEFLSYKIPDLCAKLNYSKAQLNRVFQKRYGISPHEFLVNYKFRYAKNLLVHSKMKVIDVATQIGYKNLSQFNVIFKKKFGVTPSEYRKSIPKT